MIMWASASTVAAPPMSFFIISMPLDGLMSRPPVSKHTPLPTSVIFGSAGSPQVRSIRRGARAERAPDRMDQRKVLGEEVVADDRARTLAPCCVGERAGGLLQLGRPEIVGRRVDEVAGEPHPLDHAGEVVAVEIARNLEPDLLLLRLAVAAEAIGPEREGERRQPLVMRRIGEAVGPGGSSPGRRPGRNGSRNGLSRSLEAEQHAGQACGSRQQQVSPRLGLEPGGLGERPGGGIQPAADFPIGRAGDEPDRDRLRRFTAADEDRVHEKGPRRCVVSCYHGGRRQERSAAGRLTGH